MLTRTSLLAFTAAAVVGLAAAVAPTVASAKNGNGGHDGGHHGGHGIHGMHGGFKIGFRHEHRRHHFVRWHRNYRIVQPVTTYATYSQPAAPTCNCLTKTYLDNGAVLFQDTCTKESAMNPSGQQAEVK